MVKFIVPIFVLIAFFLGAKKDNVTSTDSLTSDDALVSAKIDIASDDVSNIVDQLFDNIDGSAITYRGVNDDNAVFQIVLRLRECLHLEQLLHQEHK